MERIKDCIDRDMNGFCLIDSYFMARDVLCKDVVTCAYTEKNYNEIIAVKDGTDPVADNFGVIRFGKDKGKRWIQLKPDYLEWIRDKSSLNYETRKKAGLVLRYLANVNRRAE